MLSPLLHFFRTKRSISEIKAELLPAYFKIWAESTASEALVLADLQAGPGYEMNGEKAVALQILEAFQEQKNATGNEEKKLKIFLGDVSKANLLKLKQSLLTPAEAEPEMPENIFLLNETENRKTLWEMLQKVPGLLVADLFSSALAQEISAETLAAENTNLFLLFDHKKLERTFLAGNPTVLMELLFGEKILEIKTKMQLEKSALKREQFLIRQLEKALEKLQYRPLFFKINAPGKTGNAVYLVLAGKTKTSYFQAKEFLQAFSEFQEDGVPLFGVNLNYQPAAIPGFSDFLNKYSLEHLMQELAGCKTDFHYQTIREIYEAHSPGTHYILENYVSAFKHLRKRETVNLVDASNKKVTKTTPEAVVFYRLHSK